MLRSSREMMKTKKSSRPKPFPSCGCEDALTCDDDDDDAVDDGGVDVSGVDCFQIEIYSSLLGL